MIVENNKNDLFVIAITHTSVEKYKFIILKAFVECHSNN